MRAIRSSRFSTRTRCDERARRTSKPASRGKSTLSPGSIVADVGADRRDDAGAALRRLVRGHDQAARQLGLVERLEDDVVVERLERHVGQWMPFEHAFTILAPCASAETTSRSRTRTSCSSRSAGLTKGDLVSYYVERGAELALPHLRRRPFHMKRFPNGVDGEFFHQKRVPEEPSGATSTRSSCSSRAATRRSSRSSTTRPALAWVANLGCIELHTWHSRVPEIEQPDYLLIDLDPTTDGQWPFVREIALVVREVMDELGLRSYPKTSGATGLHILAPIKPRARVPRRAPAREGARRGGRAPHRRPGGRDDDVAGRRSRRRLRRLRPERARPHDRVRVLGAPDAGRARLGAAALGRGRDRRAGGVHARDDARADRGGRRPDARACGAARRRCARASSALGLEPRPPLRPSQRNALEQRFGHARSTSPEPRQARP